MFLRVTFSILCFSFLNYNTLKTNIISNRNGFKKEFANATNKSETLHTIQSSFTKHLTEDIIPQWYGTKWAFDGHTETPKKGTIACGYFVSTTLRDMGININRYKLAQKAPYYEAKIIACGTNIETLQNKTKEQLKAYFINNKKEGIYFIGLDFHVGFILKEKKNIYFIHSNYLNNLGPVKEKIEDSEAINSQVYHICNITHNDVLLKKWINNEVISTK